MDAEVIMINMLLADPSEVMRIGLRSVLAARQVHANIDEVTNVVDMMGLVASRKYEVLVLEPLLQNGGEETLIRALRNLAPALKILAFTSMSEGFFGRRMLKCGVRGYVMKTCPEDNVVAAIRSVADGRMYMSDALRESLASRLLDDQAGSLHDTLNEREVEIFSMMICGKTHQEISTALGLRSRMTSTYKARVLKKLHVHSLVDAVKYAIAQNLVEDCHVKCMSPL